ncbi:MAG: DUF151 domain-containing protein [Dysgonamonadaceae bacterium]|nr:DUF151 domain-containing protein [Dysgonamonadaceae bacterium]
MKKIRLKLIGLTFSQVQAGAYAVILAEKSGQRRVSIIIGTPEAQAIAIYLDKLKPPRPLTHDLFVSFMDMMNVRLKEVHIYRYDDGVFFSNLIFSEKDKEFYLDSRISDAIALALRTGAMITIDEKVMMKTAVTLENTDYFEELEDLEDKQEEDLEQMKIGDLQQALEEAVETEDYERASYLRDIINGKKK